MLKHPPLEARSNVLFYRFIFGTRSQVEILKHYPLEAMSCCTGLTRLPWLQGVWSQVEMLKR